MIYTSQRDNRPAEAVIYYIRLKTYGGHRLFALGSAPDLREHIGNTLISPFAKVVAQELLIAADHRKIVLDQWAIVPDALHVLLLLHKPYPVLGASLGKPRLLNSFIAGVKAATAKRINLIRNQPGCPVWQRSYQEQKIADKLTLTRLRTSLQETQGIVVSSQHAMLEIDLS